MGSIFFNPGIGGNLNSEGAYGYVQLILTTAAYSHV